MSKKQTRKQLIEELQKLFEASFGVALPPEQLGEQLEFNGSLDTTVEDFLIDCLVEDGICVRLADADMELEDVSNFLFDRGWDKTHLYDRAAILKQVDRYLRDAMGDSKYVANHEALGLMLCDRCNRTNKELEAMIKSFSELERVATEQEAHGRTMAEVYKALDRAGGAKVRAALKAVE